MNLKKHDDIQKRIDKYKVKKAAIHPIENGNQAFNIAIELVAGMIVGVIVGLFFDNLFDSKPLFLIICLTVSIIASFRLIWSKYIKRDVTEQQ